jgi:hypothetical protein
LELTIGNFDETVFHFCQAKRKQAQEDISLRAGMHMNAFLLLISTASCAAVYQYQSAADPPKNYTVLSNTDFFGFNVGNKRGCTSFAECASACWESPAHMSIFLSWNDVNILCYIISYFFGL